MDTIIAPATAIGGALAIIRVSGPDAISMTDKIFLPVSGIPLADKKGYTISYGTIGEKSDGETVDEVTVSLFRNPRSYTGEDMVEISCHASPYVVRRIVQMFIDMDARTAEAGEFTVRAFLSGKIDLSQAEAVADMIASSDKASHDLAISQLRGGYSEEFAVLREELLSACALVELELDFAEEDVTFADRARIAEILHRTAARVDMLTGSFSLGNALKEGIAVVLAGEPNVGKSTLLNTLLKEERAMVSDIAGTTRDVIEESIVLDGIRFRFLDTAGIRSSEDPLENMGIERSMASIDKAGIVLWMVSAEDFLKNLQSGKYEQSPYHSDNTVRISRDLLPFQVKPEQHIYLIVNKIDQLTEQEAASLRFLTEDYPASAITPSPSHSDFQRKRTSHTAPRELLAENSSAENAVAPDRRTFHTTQPSAECNAQNNRMSNCETSDDPMSAPLSFTDTYIHLKIIPIAAKSGINTFSVVRQLIKCVESDLKMAEGCTIISNTRHYEALMKALESLTRAQNILEAGTSSELLAQELRQTTHHLGIITGEITTDDLLGTIFSKFCIGK